MEYVSSVVRSVHKANLPLAGLDVESRVFTSTGPPTKPVAFTARQDVARSLGELCVLAMLPMGDVAIPDTVRIAGDCVSIKDVAGYLSDAQASSVEIKELPIAGERARLEAEWKTQQVGSPADFIR